MLCVYNYFYRFYHIYFMSRVSYCCVTSKYYVQLYVLSYHLSCFYGMELVINLVSVGYGGGGGVRLQCIFLFSVDLNFLFIFSFSKQIFFLVPKKCPLKLIIIIIYLVFYLCLNIIWLMSVRYSMCCLPVSKLVSPAVKRSSNPDSGKILTSENFRL